ncbi:hypothetical protein EON83_30110 [bacterium]|nr:MAG: hypothetical protein EON83_30110 [bacterium]
MIPTAPIRLFFLIFAVLLSSCRDAALTAPSVDGFDLVFDTPDEPAAFGLFDVGYAIKANYGYFTYRGEIYRSVGGGSVLIRPITSSPAQFVVRETVLSSDKTGSVKRSKLEILDKRTGEELASRKLVAYAIEDGTGWTGDHAIKFVRKVLESKQLPRRSWGVVDYVQTEANVELVRSAESLPYQPQVTPNQCPPSIQIVRGQYTTMNGPGFKFLTALPLQFVTCNAKRVLVASGVYASNLNLDLLTLDGIHIAQGYVRLPLPVETRLAAFEGVDLTVNEIKATLLVNKDADRESFQSSYARIHINTTLKPFHAQR